jgi:hypothetical protein
MTVQPMNGTKITWKEGEKNTYVHGSILIRWFVHDLDNDLIIPAFDTLMDVDIRVTA